MGLSKNRRKEIENLSLDNSLTFDDDGFNLTLETSPKDSLDLKLVDNSPEHRRLFLQFIREEAGVLDYTADNSKSKSDEHKTRCTKCRQPSKYCTIS